METTSATPRKDRAFYTHVISLSFTKLCDGLVDPKLVLAWVLTTVGAGAFWVGLLVPVREAGALLPQLFTAEPIRQLPIRKWAWIGGSVVQGFAAAGIGIAALTLSGATAGAVIVLLVAVLAVARSVSSVSYKDVLGKTVAKPLRGQSAGTAASVAAAGVLVFGFLLLFGVVERYTLVVGGLFVAGLLWLVAALNFTRLAEPSSDTGSIHTRTVWHTYWQYLSTDRELLRLIVARALLLATAIAPPFLVLLAGSTTAGPFTQLGALVLASAFASLVSGQVWGVFSDRSTARVLQVAGLAAAGVLLAVVGLATLGYFSNVWVVAGSLFLLMVAYQGVRIGRSTHLVNIATEQTRTSYTAISNALIGAALLVTGTFGALVPFIGLVGVIGLLAAMCFLGSLVARRMTA